MTTEETIIVKKIAAIKAINSEIGQVDDFMLSLATYPIIEVKSHDINYITDTAFIKHLHNYYIERRNILVNKALDVMKEQADDTNPERPDDEDAFPKEIQ